MAKNVDLFKASKEMSKRVGEFMTIKVWNITLKSRLKREIADLENKIVNLENLRGSIFSDEDIDAQKKTFEEESTAKQEALKKQIEDEATFEFTENDKAFYKAYKAAKTDAQIKDAIVKWFEFYNVKDAKGSTIVNNIADAIDGKKRSTARTIIRSEAKQFNDAKRTKNDVLILMYGELAEAMLRVGTLKPTAIPEDVREFYAPKKNK